MDLTEAIACLGTYSEPFGADADYGTGNAHSATAVEFSVDTRDYGLTCRTNLVPERQPWAKVSSGSSAAPPTRPWMDFSLGNAFWMWANLGLVSAGGIANTSGIGFFRC